MLITSPSWVYDYFNIETFNVLAIDMKFPFFIQMWLDLICFRNFDGFQHCLVHAVGWFLVLVIQTFDVPKFCPILVLRCLAFICFHNLACSWHFLVHEVDWFAIVIIETWEVHKLCPFLTSTLTSLLTTHGETSKSPILVNNHSILCATQLDNSKQLLLAWKWQIHKQRCMQNIYGLQECNWLNRPCPIIIHSDGPWLSPRCHQPYRKYMLKLIHFLWRKIVHQNTTYTNWKSWHNPRWHP